MLCEEIRRLLKPFLEDLLSEEEYRAFVQHLDTCPACGDYARSFGCISNDLWKLGSLTVPSDFVPTVLYKLEHGQPQVSPPKAVPYRKWRGRIFVVILLLAGFFVGRQYVLISQEKLTRANHQPAQMPATTHGNHVQTKDFEFPGNEHAPIVINVQPPSEENTAEESVAETSVEAASKEGFFSSPTPAPVIQTKPLHWHYTYSQDAQKQELLSILTDAGIRFSLQEAGVVMFEASGKQIREALEKIMLLDRGPDSLEDFTPAATAFAGKRQRASLYFDNKEVSALHWHISFITLSQKEQSLPVIRQKAETIIHSSDELLVFSIQRTEVDNLRAKLLAAKATLTEYGGIGLDESQLLSRPVWVSIYFLK